MSPRTALSAGLLVLGLATTGCGAEVNVGDPTPSATTAAPTTAAPTATTAAPTTSAAPTTTAAGADPAGALPAAFPLPPGAVVQQVVTETGEIAATLTVPDGKIAYTYWATALPIAGYTVVSAEMVGGIGEVKFSGPGCPGDSQIGVSGTDVAVQCTQR